jgi:hypothetical protein
VELEGHLSLESCYLKHRGRATPCTTTIASACHARLSPVAVKVLVVVDAIVVHRAPHYARTYSVHPPHAHPMCEAIEALARLNATVETKLAAAEAAVAADKTAAPLGPEFHAVKRPMSALYAGAPVYVKRSQAMVWGFSALGLAMLVKGGLVAGLPTVLVCMLVMFLAYDVYSGVLHIVLDCPANISLPLLGQACLEFQWHHHIPTDIVRKPFLEVCGDLNLAVGAMCAIHVLWSSQMGSKAVPLILTALKLGMAYFGQFSHRTAHDFKCTSSFAKGLQRAGLMISQLEHKAHHKPPHDIDYCLVGVCNRPVDALRKAIPNDRVWLVIFLLWTIFDVKLLSCAIEALMGTPQMA